MLCERLAPYGLSDERIAAIAIEQKAIIEDHKITDWTSNLDVQKTSKRRLDNQLYEIERAAGAQFDAGQLDALIEQVVEIAKARDRRSTSTSARTAFSTATQPSSTTWPMRREKR